MAIVRNAIVCLEGEQLPIFKETVEKVVERFLQIQGEEKDVKWTSKSMLDGEEARVRVCEPAKDLIQKEIQAQEQQFDLEKMAQELAQGDFLELGRQVD